MNLKIFLFIAIINCVNTLKGIGIKGIGLYEKSWKYELRSLKTNSSNTDLLSIDLRIVRILRGVYAVSGSIRLNFDYVEGDTNRVGLKIYRSPNGDGNFKILPFQMPMTHMFKALNTFYNELIMKSIKDCSNFPYFEGEFVPPLEKKTYTMSKCQISKDGFPNHLQDGYYKMVLSGSGDVEYVVEVIVEIENDV